MTTTQRKATTYLGTIDDMVLRYPWNFQVNSDFLNREIFRCVATRRNILINDGYLFNHPLAFEQLVEGHESPLRTLAGIGEVQILCRDKTTENIHEVPEKMAKEGIETFKQVISHPDWPQQKEKIRHFGEMVRTKGEMVYWPPTDMSVSFQKLVRRLEDVKPNDIGLTSVSHDLFRTVIDHFQKKMSNEKRAPRDRWEKICKSVVTSYDVIDEKLSLRQLMNLANEMYHYNFGLALSAATDFDVAVDTQFSPAFGDLLKLEGGGEDITSVPRIHFPKNIPYSDGARLVAFCDPGTRIGKARDDYVETMDSYLNGNCGYEDAKTAAHEYEVRIHEHFGQYRDLTKGTRPITFGLAILGAAAGFWIHPSLGLFVGVITWGGGEFVVPRLVKSFRIDEAVAKIIQATEKEIRSLDEPISNGRAICSLPIDRQKAVEFLQGVPRFD